MKQTSEILSAPNPKNIDSFPNVTPDQEVNEKRDKKNSASQNVCPDPFAQGINSMFGRIANSYDFLNHALSLGVDLYWRKVLVNELLKDFDLDKKDTLKVLDLATGTFDVALSLYRNTLKYQSLKLNIAAIDLCTPMLIAGKNKLLKNKAESKIFPLTANGVSLPLADNSMDLACVSFGIRNISPREASLEEFFRVLKPGGKLCILEFGSAKKPIWGGFYNFYLNKILPKVGAIVSGDKTAYQYLAESIKAFPLADELKSEISKANFKQVKYRSLNAGIVYLHSAYK
ncbi:ubiquinone/menaquinone biosynthesis methyltransferase [Desulfovibrio litoralis]|uniref:Demethylmenaquinone methyltransferase n=1 Tax=Desulfovibrio litoralis DSM 11393 TaxID=1121455 RepID=A0A1M7RW91_9BACT|nr:ubiquinone/menaquinone biosynthesis methyltransferase [Desulfovibrio litoralis]SHN50500.1 demethylmenaquinone methyltransferase [Desulfovibrio litoralis DSM 11393]